MSCKLFWIKFENKWSVKSQQDPVLVFHLECAWAPGCLFSGYASFTASLWVLLTLSALPQPFPFWEASRSTQLTAANVAAWWDRHLAQLPCLSGLAPAWAACAAEGEAELLSSPEATGRQVALTDWSDTGQKGPALQREKWEVLQRTGWSQRLDWLRTLTAFRATSEERPGTLQDVPTKPPSPTAFEGEKQFYYTTKCLLFICFGVLLVCFITSFQVGFFYFNFMCMVILPVCLQFIMYVL